MAVKHICDRCGSEEGVGRVTLNIAVSTPHKADRLPKWDYDLCAKCLKEAVDLISPHLIPITRS